MPITYTITSVSMVYILSTTSGIQTKFCDGPLYLSLGEKSS